MSVAIPLLLTEFGKATRLQARSSSFGKVVGLEPSLYSSKIGGGFELIDILWRVVDTVRLWIIIFVTLDVMKLVCTGMDFRFSVCIQFS